MRKHTTLDLDQILVQEAAVALGSEGAGRRSGDLVERERVELADTSVWARKSHPALRDWFVSAIEAGTIAACDVSALELLHSAPQPGRVCPGRGGPARSPLGRTSLRRLASSSRGLPSSRRPPRDDVAKRQAP